MSPKNLNVSKKTHKLLLNKLKDKRTLQIYKKFESELNINKNFIVAVSGGPDSIALSFLAKIYSIKKSLNVKYFIVDHKLRKNSTSEANFVKEQLKKFLINLNILTWHGAKPNKNIQSMAREKRYNLLVNQAKKFKIENKLQRVASYPENFHSHASIIFIILAIESLVNGFFFFGRAFFIIVALGVTNPAEIIYFIA